MKCRWICFLPIVLFSCVQSNKAMQNDSTVERRFADNIVIAHRGAWKHTHTPENSLASLKAAIAGGYYGSETDVHMTGDGQIVVNHDPTYQKKDIQTSTLEELRTIPLANGEPLPLLGQFLKEITAQRRTRLILEIKSSTRGKEWAMKTVRKVVEEVKKYHAQPYIVYISFDYAMCLEVLRLQPDAEVQYLNGDKSPQEVSAAGLFGIDYNLSVFKRHPQYFADARSLGIKTNAWTVNDSTQVDWLIENKVDFITTNEPEMVLRRTSR